MLQASVVFAEQIAERDVIWFCDNQVVYAALVRGSCASDDIASIVVLCHLLWASVAARVWIEWVPSEAHVSDGLSRSGTADDWTCQQNWHLGATPCLPWHLIHAEPLLSAVDTLRHWDREIHWVNQGTSDECRLEHECYRWRYNETRRKSHVCWVSIGWRTKATRSLLL